jgi:two-component system LytT family response regulator
VKRLIRAVVVDDEPLARRTILDLLATDDEIEVCCECSGGKAAVAAVQEMQPDLVFLDIQMPDMNGFEVLETLMEEPGNQELPFIVFVTAHDRFALRAFEYHALDYILKPFTDARFLEAVVHAKKQIATAKSAAVRKQLAGLLREYRKLYEPLGSDEERFAIQSGGRTVFVDLRDVVWFEAAEHYIQVHTRAKSIICRESMTKLEARLDPNRFLRVHRSAIVNVSFIEELLTVGRNAYELRLCTGKRLNVSRKRIKKLKQDLGL